ncbi:MAG: hypothetical protein K2Y32_00280 [Candidatus Obscuribacterales bacterium]|nr:hypothetical protein [Candidatus Obscuribacterales bacterium]
MEINATPAGYSMGIDIDKPTAPPPAPATNAGEPPAGTKSFLDSVPEEYRSKEWLTNFAKTENPLGEILKSYDNQLGLIGRKSEGIKVPGEGATADDWAAFHKAIGVPESPDKYEYAPPTVKDELKEYFKPDDNLLKHMKEAALKAGVRPEGFKVLAEALDNYYVGELDKALGSTNQMLADLENKFKQKFGERSDQVLNGWQKSFEAMPAESKTVIESLDPRVKVVLADAWETFAKKYIREDKLDLNVPNLGSAMTEAEYGEEFKRLFAATRSAQPGTAAHIEAEQKLEALRKKGAMLFQSKI